MTEPTDRSDRPAPGGAAPRKRDRAATRAALLEVARLRFARDGYDATSVRDVAGDAGVDPALVFRYFGSKKRLFDEASTVADPAAEPLAEPPGELPVALLRSVVFGDWADYAGEHPLVAMLRSSAHPDTRRRLYEQCERYVHKLEEQVAGPDAGLRAELLSACLLGTAVLRSVVRTPALSAATAEDVEPYFEQVAAALLGRRTVGE